MGAGSVPAGRGTVTVGGYPVLERRLMRRTGAHLWLSRFARQEGDADRGLAEALQCLSLAPTTARAYIEVAVCHAEQEQYAQGRGDVDPRGFRGGVAAGGLPVHVLSAGVRAVAHRSDERGGGLLHDGAARTEHRIGGDRARRVWRSCGSRSTTRGHRWAVAEAEQVLHAANIPVSPTEAALDAMGRCRGWADGCRRADGRA